MSQTVERGGPVACSIVSNNYLPFARVFARSLLEHHPDAEIYVCLVDRPHPSLSYDDEPFEVVFAEQLDIPRFQNFAFRYSILELNTAVKPFFLRYLHEEKGCSQLCYFDPDILVTADLGELYERVATSDAVLTPHILEPIDDQASPGETDFLLSGSYNLGFLGLRFHDATLRFLSWWEDRLYRLCLNRVEEGLFVDQRWMDLAPSFLDEVSILHDPGYNVAYWNLVHRRVDRRDGAHWVGDARLRFFHFSGFHPEQLEAISKHQDRFRLSERPDLADLFDDYRRRLLGEGYRQMVDLPYAFSDFDNGVRIPLAARRALQEEDPEGERWPDPFATGGAASFYRWLRGPRSPKNALGIPRIALAFRDMRQDLRRTFADPEGRDRRAFVSWLASTQDLDEVFTADLRNAVLRSDVQLKAVRQGEAERFDNGVRVPLRLREILADLDPDARRWPLPLDTRVADSFYDHLRTPTQAGDVFPRLLLAIWRLRSDLQDAFPRPEDVDSESFADWVVAYGAEEERLDPPFYGQVRSWLDEQRRRRVVAALLDQDAGTDGGTGLGALADDDLSWALEAGEREVADADRVFRGRPVLTRLALLVHRLRADVRAQYPDPLGASREAFAAWLVVDGRREFRLPRRVLAPTLRELPFKARLSSELRGAVGLLFRNTGSSKTMVSALDTVSAMDTVSAKDTVSAQDWSSSVDPPGDAPAAPAEWQQRLRSRLESCVRRPLTPTAFDALVAALEASGGPLELAEGLGVELVYGADENAMGESEALAERFEAVRSVDLEPGLAAGDVVAALVEPSERSEMPDLADQAASFVWAGGVPAVLPAAQADRLLFELFRVTAPGGVVAFDVDIDADLEAADEPVGESASESASEAEPRSVDEWIERLEISGGTTVVDLPLTEGGRRLGALKAERDAPFWTQTPPMAPARVSRAIRPPLVERRWSEWLETTDETGRDVSPMNRFSLALWLTNSFMQEQFPLTNRDDRTRFHYWLGLVNHHELKIQDWLLGLDWSAFERPVESLSGPGEDSIRLFDWLVWTLRPDIQSQFSLDRRDGRDGFRAWVAAARSSEYADDVSRLRRLAKRQRDSGAGETTKKVPRALGGRLPGVNLVEHSRATLGVLEITHLNQQALERAGVPHEHFRLFDSSERPDWARQNFRHRVNLVHSNADQVLKVFGEMGPQLWDGRYNIGYFWWELPFCPEEWQVSFDLVDEIWVGSRFVYEAFARASPVPVLHLPSPVRAEPEAGLTRSDFELPEDAYLFIATFDVSSFASRKNPTASVEAFRRAFPDDDRGVGLVLKAANADEGDPAWQVLLEVMDEDPRIQVINELMPREQVLALVELCDAYVSLHRSEGFGLGPAEALLLGRPIVATGYSGNLDYCSPDTACLVDYRLVPVAAGEYPYHRSQVWAEPDLDHAAWHMANLRHDRREARQTAAAGRRFIRRNYHQDVVGRRYRDRLRALGFLT